MDQFDKLPAALGHEGAKGHACAGKPSGLPWAAAQQSECCELESASMCILGCLGDFVGRKT